MKHKLKELWFLFILLPIQTFAQITINGSVIDKEALQPIPYVTIYINETTIGTITNISGRFTIEKVMLPCEIVFSHISYETVVISFDQNSETNINVELKPKVVELGAIEVTDKNRREENLRHFKERFLGTDYWGKHAYFENDSVLIFHREKVSESENGRYVSGLLEADSSSTLFTVNTKGPLLVNLPLLGYRLQINLIHYTELQTGNDTDYEFHTLGYFYFQPEENTSKRKTNRFKKKRLKAYYNSDRHFCRSLFSDRLKENGYNVLSSELNPETEWYDFKEIEFDKHIIRTGNEVKIIGLKNKNFIIEYFEYRDHPFNLKDKEEGQSLLTVLSKIYFLKDTCTIRADGSRPDNSIMFSPEIGNKRVGAMLPYDFQPENVK